MLGIDEYNSWNILKQYIQFNKNTVSFPKPGEIWYIHIGLNIGFESIGKGEDYKRPFLVIKKLGNMFLGVSMTTKGKENNNFYSRIDDSYFGKKSYIVKSQVKSLDNKRFLEKIGKISNHDFYNIKKELQTFWF